jgi:hypothetical protein
LVRKGGAVGTTEAERIALDQVREGALEVRPDGTIWRLKTYRKDGSRRMVDIEPRKMEWPMNCGYLRLTLDVEGTTHNVLNHRLVYLVLVGDIPDGYVINHINGIKSDNRPENLEAVTPRENIRHMIDVLEVGAYGEQHHDARLTEDDVRYIRSLYDGVAFKSGQATELAKRFGISRMSVYNVAKRKTWKHVS